MPTLPRSLSSGTVLGCCAYLVWGSFPLFFHLLADSGAVEVLMHRIVWSLVVCLLVIALSGNARAVLAVLHDRRALTGLTIAAVLIAVNWGFYLVAVHTAQVVEAALGYFLNPLITVGLGVLVLRERLRPGQRVAVGIGALALLVLLIGYGRVPWLALLLACTFAGYSLVKKQVGPRAGALPGLTVETLVLAPAALVGLALLQLGLLPGLPAATFTLHPPRQALLLAASGVVTVLPLALFAAAARRVPLSTMGLLQFLTPVLQLLCAVLLLGEHVPIARWAGFALVWVALAVLTVDSLRAATVDSVHPVDDHLGEGSQRPTGRAVG